MDAQPRVVPASAVDVRAHAALQQRVFGAVLADNDIPLERLGPHVFAWKLRPPAGEAQVATIEDAGVILSTCTAFPVELTDGRRAWHLCDAATAPEAQGRGLFGRVLSHLIGRLPSDEWLFAFPNGQSGPAFARRGFEVRMTVPLRVRPVRGRVPTDVPLEPVEEFGPAHDAFAQRLRSRLGRAALRGASYLRWRYLAHPYFRYQCLELRRDGEVHGLLVVNRMEARGRVSLWLMELLALDAAAERALARAAVRLGHEQGCDVVLAARSAKVPGTFRVPPCFLPKQHRLMVRVPAHAASDDPWHVETGDWDTF